MKNTINSMRTPPSVVFVLAFTLWGLSSCQHNIESEPWFVSAQNYVKADNTMTRNAAEEIDTVLEHYTVRDNAASQLLKVPAPPLPRLDALLHSNNALLKKVALVNIMLRKINNNRLLESILETYHIEDDTFTKFYSLRCFRALNDIQLGAFQDSLIKILSLEKDENIIISAMPSLIRLKPSKVKRLFSKYLKSGTVHLRVAVIIYLEKMGTDLLNEVYDELKREGVRVVEFEQYRKKEKPEVMRE